MDNDKYVRKLTLKDIADDVNKPKPGNRGIWFLFAFVFVVILVRMGKNWVENGWEAVVGSTDLENVILLAVAVVLWQIIKWVVAKRKEKEALAESVYLVCNPLVKKEESEGGTPETTWTDYDLYFNLHTENGRYHISCEYKQFCEAKVGEEYYLVLAPALNNKLRPVKIYPKNSTELDAQLTKMLERDQALTGCNAPVLHWDEVLIQHMGAPEEEE